MKTELVEIIILLNGNFIPVGIKSSEITEWETLLANAIKKGKDDPFYFIKLGPATVLTKNILGWYIRPRMENPSDKMIKFLEKKMPDADDGNDWKKDTDDE